MLSACRLNFAEVARIT